MIKWNKNELQTNAALTVAVRFLKLNEKLKYSLFLLNQYKGIKKDHIKVFEKYLKTRKAKPHKYHYLNSKISIAHLLKLAYDPRNIEEIDFYIVSSLQCYSYNKIKPYINVLKTYQATTNYFNKEWNNFIDD